MALFLFTRKILAGEPIDVFNHGHHQRDFTYIDDIVEGTVRVSDSVPVRDDAVSNLTSNRSAAPWRVFNIGNNQSVELGYFIEVLENVLGRKAKKNMLPLQPGDVSETSADVSALEQDIGYRPKVTVDEGIRSFVDWYRDYYGVQV